MTVPLRLIVFDVDGTLVDSQRDIIAAMTIAFEQANIPAPQACDILSIVGLSLNVAIERLAPEVRATTRSGLVQGYKDAYMVLRAQTGAAESSPLYPGAARLLTKLQEVPENILGIATGKSKRGLDKLLDGHSLQNVFVTRQVADFHPSKPHPAMLLAAMSETGIAPEHTVMIGDTSYDMDMANAAGTRSIGVSWGYQDVARLKAANCVVDSFGALDTALNEVLGVSA